MELYNAIKGLTANYTDEGGVETITVEAEHLDVRGVYAGPGNYSLLAMTKHAFFQVSIAEKYLVYPASTSTSVQKGNNGKTISVQLPKRFSPVGWVSIGYGPDSFIIVMPLVNINGIKGALGLRQDVSVCLLRSVPVNTECVPERPSLSVTRQSATATASIALGIDGGIEGTLSVSGEGYYKIELVLQRRLGNAIIEETIGQVLDGTANFAWKPTFHNFDRIAIVPGMLSSDAQIDDFFRPLGADIRKEIADFTVYWVCDGPGIVYPLLLKGHKMLNPDVDVMRLSVNFGTDQAETE